jgi:hypothetical protein
MYQSYHPLDVHEWQLCFLQRALPARALSGPFATLRVHNPQHNLSVHGSFLDLQSGLVHSCILES